MNLIKNNRDKKRALDILENAFIDSPGMTWMLRKCNKKNLRIFLSFFYHTVAIKDGAYLTSDRNGVVFFYQLQNKKTSISNLFRKLYVLLFIVGLKKGMLAAKYKKNIDKLRPKSGWFGWLVATDTKVSGNAAAYQIKQEMFRLADETQEPIYVETTNPRVMLLYKKSGYLEYANLKHPYQDLTIWFMKRENAIFNNT